MNTQARDVPLSDKANNKNIPCYTDSTPAFVGLFRYLPPFDHKDIAPLKAALR